MVLLKKAPAAEPFRVPSLAEADEQYADLQQKLTALHEGLSKTTRDRSEAERKLAADTSPELPLRVSELLGDAPSPKARLRQEIAELKRREADIEEAIRIIGQRLRDAKTPALRKAIALVRPEWDRRMRSMIDTMRALDTAHRAFDDLCLDIEAEEIEPAHLGPRPYFLGGARESTRRIASYIKEAGYGD
jgi:hypothetical protein